MANNNCFTRVLVLSLVLIFIVSIGAANTDLNSEISLNSFNAEYTTGEAPEDYKGVIIAELNTTSSLESVSLSLEDSEGNPVITHNFSSEEINENNGIYTVGIPVPDDDEIYGDYNAEIVSLNGANVNESNDIYSSTVFIGSEGDETGDGSKTSEVDDFYVNTSTDYSVNSAFKGHNLNLTAEEGVFTLVDNVLNIVDEINVSQNENLSTEDLTEGRYYLNNSERNVSSIDIFKPNADVISRIANFSSPEIRIFSYTRAEEVSLDSNKVNVSGPEEWKNSEHVFRLNTSLDRYWVQVEGEDRTAAYASRTAKQERLERCDNYENDEEESGGSSETVEDEDSHDNDYCLEGDLSEPYIQDLQVENAYNVSGTVYNVDNQNQTVSNLELRLVKNEQDYTLDRRLLRESPPYITTQTDQDGDYTFEKVPAAGYNLYIENESWAREPGRQYFEPDVWVTGNDNTKDLTVTNNTGILNLTIDGPQEGFFYGYNLNKVNEIGWYSKAGIGTGQTNITLPIGKYYLGMERRSTSGDSAQRRTLSINISQGNLTNVSTSYAETVYLNGTIRDSNGAKIDMDDAYVSFRSGEGYKSYWTRVENGNFSRLVAENTNYTVRLSPSYGSTYTEKEKEVWMNESSEMINFTLEPGKYVSGEVKAGQENVEAYVSITNRTRGIYRSSETEDGIYNVTGLENGSYNVEVRPESPRYSYSSKQVTIDGASNDSVDFQVGEELVQVNGTVTLEGEGSPEGFEVKIESRDRFVEDREQEVDSTGYFNFTVPADTYYRIGVEGEFSGQEVERYKTRYASRNETVEFNFETLVSFDGIVKTDSGERIRAWIGARNFSERSRDYTRTGDDGTFELKLSNTSHEVMIEPHPSENVGPKQFKVPADNITGMNITYDTSNYTYVHGQVDFQGINSSEGFIAIGNESEQSFNYQRLDDGSFNLTGVKDVGHRVFIASREGNLREETTISAPSDIGNEKNFTLGESAKKEVVIRTHRGSSTGPLEPNVTIQTSQTEKLTNTSGVAEFKVEPTSTTRFYIDKEGFESTIEEVTVDGDTNSISEVDIGINQTQEYNVRINVSKENNNNTEISPPASVVFVSRNNQSSEGGSVTVNTEGARPTVEGLTAGEYLVGLAEGPETTFVNRTANIPENNALGYSDTVNMTNSNGETQYRVWYEVTQ